MTAVECLKQDIDRELKHGTKMVVNWDMYLQMERQDAENKAVHFAEWLTNKDTLTLMALYEHFEETEYKRQSE